MSSCYKLKCYVFSWGYYYLTSDYIFRCIANGLRVTRPSMKTGRYKMLKEHHHVDGRKNAKRSVPVLAPIYITIKVSVITVDETGWDASSQLRSSSSVRHQPHHELPILSDMKDVHRIKGQYFHPIFGYCCIPLILASSNCLFFVLSIRLRWLLGIPGQNGKTFQFSIF